MARQSKQAETFASRMYPRNLELPRCRRPCIGVSVASATTTDEAPLRDSQSPFASSTASRSLIPMLKAENRDVGGAKTTLSERLEHAIRERDTIYHSLNDIKVRFQKAEHDLRAVKTQKHASI